MKTPAQTQHAELMAAALAQIEHNPENWGVTGDMGDILQRLHEVT